MRIFPIAVVALLAVAGFSAIPQRSEVETLWVACDAPNSLIGTDTGPLIQTEGVACQVHLDTTVTTSQFFGFSTKESNHFATRRGSVDFVSSFVRRNGGDMTRDQMSACMDAMAEELAATTAATAVPSPGLDEHFRLTCG